MMELIDPLGAGLVMGAVLTLLFQYAGELYAVRLSEGRSRAAILGLGVLLQVVAAVAVWRAMW